MSHKTPPLPRVSKLIKSSWSTFSAQWKTFIALGLISALPASLLSVAKVSYREFHVVRDLPFFVIAFILLALAIVIIGVWLWSQAAIVYAATKSVKEKISAQDAFSESKRYILQLLGIDIAAMLAIVGGLVLLIVPGVILVVWFTYARYVLIHENIHGISALERSRSYTRGRFWKTVGVLLPLLLLAFASLLIVWLLSALLSLPYEALSPLSEPFIVPLCLLYVAHLYAHVSAQSTMSADEATDKILVSNDSNDVNFITIALFVGSIVALFFAMLTFMSVFV